MLDAIISPAAAEPLEHAVSGLGPLPIVQFGVVVIIAIIAVIVYIKTKTREPRDGGVEVHFDGMLLEHVNAVKAMTRVLEELTRALAGVHLTNAKLADLRQELADRRQKIYDRIEQSETEGRRQLSDVRELAHGIDRELARMQGRPYDKRGG